MNKPPSQFPDSPAMMEARRRLGLSPAAQRAALAAAAQLEQRHASAIVGPDGEIRPARKGSHGND